MNFKARFRAFWTRFGVAFSGALFLIVPALAWIWGLNVGNAIVWATGVVLLAYTIETQGMRMEMVRQNEIAIQPLLIASVQWRNLTQDYGFILRNIGKGSALYAQVSDIEVSAAGDYRIMGKFKGMDCIEPGKDSEMNVDLTLEGKGEVAQMRRDFGANLGPGSSKSYEVTITYEDVSGQKRESIMLMGKGGIRLLNHEKVRTERLATDPKQWDTNTLGLILGFVGTIVLALSGLYGFHVGFGHGIRWKPGWFYFHIIGWILFLVGFGIQLRMRE